MQKKVIIASFGTKDEKAAKDIENMEKRLSSLSPYPCIFAYSSHVMTEAGDKRNIEEVIRDNADNEIIIMPLLIQKGREYEKILSYGLKTAAPLLGREENIRRVAGSINGKLEKLSGVKYLLIAHGEEGKKNEEFEILNSLLRSDIRLRTLKGSECYKSFEIEEEVIHVIPFLLFFGHHAKHDIKEVLVPYFKKQGKIVSMIEHGILQEFPELSEIFESNFTALLKENDSLFS